MFRVVVALLAAGAGTVFAQDMHFLNAQAEGGTVAIAVTGDSGRFSLYINSGRMVVRTDSLAAWADNAAALHRPSGDSAHPRYSGARLEYTDPASHRLQAVTLVRLSADSMSDYRITGQDGEHTATVAMRADSMRQVFAAMHGDAPVLSLAKPVFMESEVERQARARPGSHAPEYPRDLRNASVSGRVETTFIVDSTGRVDVTSFQVVSSSDPQFAFAVQRALPAMRFYPAEMNGRHVSERVRMPFVFNARP